MVIEGIKLWFCIVTFLWSDHITSLWAYDIMSYEFIGLYRVDIRYLLGITSLDDRGICSADIVEIK